MKAAIFTFSKPSENSTVASTRIARFLADVTKLPLLWDDMVAHERADLLFIVNGAFAFCDCLPAIGEAVRRAKRIVWVQNDYTIKPPSASSAAESPFRKAFRVRKGEPVHYWTTVMNNADMTLLSRYVNWNSLTYEPLREMHVEPVRANDLFYYGAFRTGREQAFDDYARMCDAARIKFAISSTSGKFAERYPNAVHLPGMPRVDFYKSLAAHRMGLYIEDKKSHTEFHSPANRFYEMLSAGLPMVFQPEAVGMLAEAGIVVNPYVAATAADLKRLFKNSNDVAAEQRKVWNFNYRAQLARIVSRYFKEVSK